MGNKTAETSIQVDHDRERVDTNWSGAYDLKAVAESCRRRAHEGAHGYAQLIDGRSAEIARSFEDTRNLPRTMERLATESVESGSAGPTAIVVARSIDFGMCRMIAAYFEPAGKIGVFYTVDEAEGWLAGSR